MSLRLGSRMIQYAKFRRPFQKWHVGRRYQTTDAPQQASLASRLWNSPVGIKTVHFWAPVMKWALVLAGVSDFWRPAEKLSLTQNLALTATGAIWTRWCFVIRPKNILLAAVNFFLACVGIVQVSRILLYQQNVKNQSVALVAKDNVEDMNSTAATAAKNVATKSEAVLE